MAEAELHRDRPRQPQASQAVEPEQAAIAGRANVLMAWQQTVGNRAIQRQIQSGRLPFDLAIRQTQAIGNRAVQALIRERALVQRHPGPPGHTHLASGSRLETVLQHLREGRWDLDSLAATLTDAEMRQLTLTDRLRLVTAIGGGTIVGDDDEATVIRLLATTPAADTPRIMPELRANNSAILRLLERAIDGAEYRQYHQVLRTLRMASLGPQEAMQRMERAREFPWANPGLIEAIWNVRFHYEPIEFTDSGRLRITYWMLLGPMGLRVAHNVEVDPTEIIRVRFHAAEEEMSAEAGQVIYMPAINLMSLYNRQFRRELATVADVSLLLAGGIGVITAGSRAARVIAVLDLALGAVSLVVNEFRGQIARLEGGPEFLEAWDILQTLIMMYTLARVLAQAPEAFRRMHSTYERLRGRLSAAQARRLESRIQELRQRADEAEREVRAAQADRPRGQGETGGGRATPPVPVTSPPPPTTQAIASPPVAPTALSAAHTTLARVLGLEPAVLARFTDAQIAALTNLANGLSRDRQIGLRNLIQDFVERGRSPQRILDTLNRLEPDDLNRFLDARANIRWPRGWRGRPRVENGNLDEGWQHIEARHITGTHPDGPGDLFPRGTTRAEVEEAAREVVRRGRRVSAPQRRIQTFELRTTVHGRSNNVRVSVDASDGRVITIFPVITGP